MTNLPIKSVNKKEKSIGLQFKKQLFSFVTLCLMLLIVYAFSQHFYQIKKIPNPTLLSNHKMNLKTPKTHKAIETNLIPEIDNYLKSVQFNGTALIVRHNQILLNKGYGFANQGKQTENETESEFFIGSISKIFVSTAIMQLQSEGKLSIHDSLSKYIPDFPNGNEITLFNLLTHTSGLSEHSETNAYLTHEQLIQKIEKNRFIYPVGTHWYYSDSNYVILAYIIEKVSNSPFENYIQNHIFNVVGMTHTGFGDHIQKGLFFPTGYKIKNNTYTIPTLPNMSQLFGCGDVYTTAYDMFLFDKRLYFGELFPKSYLQSFFSPFMHHYAFGIYHDPGSYSDHGVLPGWNSLNSFSLTGKTYVILFSNIENKKESLGVIDNQIYLLLNKTNY